MMPRGMKILFESDAELVDCNRAFRNNVCYVVRWIKTLPGTRACFMGPLFGFPRVRPMLNLRKYPLENPRKPYGNLSTWGTYFEEKKSSLKRRDKP